MGAACCGGGAPAKQPEPVPMNASTPTPKPVESSPVASSKPVDDTTKPETADATKPEPVKPAETEAKAAEEKKTESTPPAEEPKAEATATKTDASASGPPLKLFLLGPPSSGKGALIEKLVKERKMTHQRETWLVKNAKAKELPSAVKAEGVEGPLPDELLCEILGEVMAAETSCVCDGLPKNEAQAEAMAKLGLTQHKLVVVDISEADLLDFHANRVVDPETMEAYDKSPKSPKNPPPEIEPRCIQTSLDQEDKVKERLAPFYTTIGKIEAAFGDNVIKVKGTTQTGSADEAAMYDDLCKQLGL